MLNDLRAVSLLSSQGAMLAAPIVGDLSHAAPMVLSTTPIVDVDRMFRIDRRLRDVVVVSGASVSLVSREFLDIELTGPFGYGRSLHARSTVGELALELDLVLPYTMTLTEAANLILARDLEARYKDVLVEDGAGDGYQVVSVSAIFERVAAMFRHVAYHDPLTGLPNRRLLEETAQVLTEQGVDLTRIAVLYVDLDGFKMVNDTYGHRAGDEVLVEFGERLRSCVRAGDVVARLGGDEFVAMLVDVSAAQAAGIAERIVLNASAAFIHNAEPLYISASVGLAMADDVASETELRAVDVLLRHADGAMLHAKRSGKRRVQRLSGATPAADVARRSLIRRRLEHALHTGTDFELHYQPKLDLRTGAVDTVEALVRWNDAQLGPVGPAEFIPIAEDNNQIDRIGRWVLDTACRQARAWLLAGTPRTVSVNVSPLQLASDSFVGDLRGALAEHELPPELLRVEITEGAAVQDPATAVAKLRQIRAFGIDIELDDFGVGYSSLARLRDLPLTAVKIDKTFIDVIDTDPAGLSIIRAVIDTAHALGLTVIAEGVERDTQLHALREAGCDSAQGYLIARPCPAGDLTDSTTLAHPNGN